MPLSDMAIRHARLTDKTYTLQAVYNEWIAFRRLSQKESRQTNLSQILRVFEHRQLYASSLPHEGEAIRYRCQPDNADPRSHHPAPFKKDALPG